MRGGSAVLLLWTATVFTRCISTARSQIVFTSSPSDTVVDEGALARFDCAFTASVPVSINWLRDGVILTPSTKYTFLVNNSLVINPTETGDDVMYTCVVTNQLNDESIQRSATLAFAVFLETFATNPATQTVDEGALVLLFCVHAGSLPPATITWQLNNQLLVSSSRIIIQSSTLGHTNPPQVSSSLAITSVQAGDEGSYTCTAANQIIDGATAVSQAGTLTIRPMPAPPVITQHPEGTILASLGQTTTLTCSASGEPSPAYTWSLNGTQVSSSSSVTIEMSDSGSVLRIAAVQSDDLGSYTCTATNSEGTVTSGSAALQLATISTEFELQPLDMIAVIGSSAIFDCVPPISTPPAIISWSKAFAQITDSRYQVLSNGSLSISDVVLTDQAVYHCNATNPVLGVSRTSMPAQLTAIGIPAIAPSSVSVEGGSTVTFSCSAEGNPPPQITWYRGTNQITEATSPRVTITGGSLTISDVSLNDEDYYTCRAVFAGEETENRAILDILSAPIFQRTVISLTAVTPLPVILPCDIFPDPSVSFSWRLSGEAVDISGSQQGYRLADNGSLVILNVREDDEGTYTCVVVNERGMAQGTVSLDVQTSPAITADTPLLNVTVGSTATLSCTSSGDPLPALTWSHDNIQLTTSGRFQISSDGRTLSILSAQYEDEGLYVCHASNSAGDDSDSVALDVQAAPLVQAMPPSQQLLVGSTAAFSCDVSGDPFPTVRWLNTQSMDVLTLGNPRIEVLSNFSLVIRDIQPEDGQQYVCEARNAVGSNVALVSLTVLAAPSVSLPPETSPVQGESLTLDCNVSGQPFPTIVWSRDGNPLELGGRIQASNGQLLFSNVLSSDSGNYSCEATNDIGMATASTVLSVLVPPIILPKAGMVTFNEGDTVILDCVSTGIPQPNVSWFRESVPLPNQDLIHIHQAQNDSLVITGVNKSDEGQYVCWASNPAGMESSTVTLSINVAPTVSAVDPSITAVQGSRVTFTCTASGDPSPVQTWTRNGIEVPGTGTSDQFTLESDGAVLVVESVREEYEGEFRCHASNAAGTAFDTVNLNVIVPPSFVQPLTNSSAVEGSPHSLTCLADGDPPPLITWSTSSTILSTQGTLLFAAVSREDTGFYRCTASNSAGSISQEVYLDILYEPAILQLTESMSVPLNSNVQLMCETDGNPIPDISWLLDGTLIPGAMETTYTISPVTAGSEGEYTCVASNSVREVSASLTLTVLFPPSAPTILTAMATSTSSVTVEWTGSTNDGGSPITSYAVEYRVGSEVTSPFTAVTLDISTREIVLNDLSPFTTYDIRVRAMNLVGPSDPSQTLTTQTHPSAPSIPGNFRITGSTSSTLSLAWDVPDPLNGNLAAYELRHGDDATFETDLQERLLITTQFTVRELDVGVVYRVEVRAGTVSLIGEILWGPFAVLRVRDGVVIEVVTEPPTTPLTTPPPTTPPTTEPPTTPEPSPTTPPAVITSEVTTLVVEETTIESTQVVSSQLSSSPVTSSTPSLATPITTMAPSPTPLPLNPPTVAPSLVTALIPPGTEGQVLVYWREPTSGLDSFVGYQIFISPAPPPSVTMPIFADKTPISGTHVISGLDHATTYTVTVATYNEDGTGPQTASDTVTTPESVPSAPRQVVVSMLNQQVVLVSWERPDPSNGIIIDYTAMLYSVPSGLLLSSEIVDLEFVSFGDLDLNNLQYRVTVSARTSAGMGPDSEPVFFGIESVSVTMTTTETRSSSESPFSSSVMPASTSSPTTPPPSTSITSSTPSQSQAPSETPTQTTSILATIQTPFDDTYYIVRIVPPVVFGLFLIAMLLVTIICFVHLRRVMGKNRMGAYKFSEFENTEGQEMQQQLTLEGEKVVASDDLTTSAYHVKDALDANFTYAPPTQQKKSSNEGEDIDEPDIGVDLNKEGEGMDTLSSPVGRDAMEESPSRPESEEVSPSHLPGNQSTPSKRPVYQPGGYSYAELDRIRAKKSEERVKRFATGGATPTQETPPRVVTFDPNLGLSSGGLMETRIGAVGASRDFSRQKQDGEVSAQMY